MKAICFCGEKVERADGCRGLETCLNSDEIGSSIGRRDEIITKGHKTVRRKAKTGPIRERIMVETCYSKMVSLIYYLKL